MTIETRKTTAANSSFLDTAVISPVTEQSIAEGTVNDEPSKGIVDTNPSPANVEVASSTVANEDAYQLDIPVPSSDIDDSDDESVINPFFSDSDEESTENDSSATPSVPSKPSANKANEIGDLINLCDDNDNGQLNIKPSEPTDSNDSDNDSEVKAIDTSGKVLWYNCANVSNAKDKMLIAHKDVTADLIKRGFYEIVGKHIIAGDKVYTQIYTRLFFDFDIASHKDTISLYNKELIPRFDKLKELFGDYSISAYSNKEHIATAIGCRFDGKASKELSLHIVFYESRLTIDDLYALTRSEKFIFPDGWDFSVYEILRRRVFRHHQSPHTGYGIKCIGEDGLPVFKPPFQLKKDGKPVFNTDGSPKMSKPDKYCPGSIIGNKPAHTQLLQPIGTEKVITLDDVLKSGVWFDMKNGITKDDITVKVSKRLIGAYISSDYSAKLVDTKRLNAILEKVKADTVDTDNDASIEYITNVNCFKYLLECFTPDFVNLQHVFWLVIVCGPYKRETLKEIVSEWYWKGEHSTPDGDSDYIDCNYVTKDREHSDMWFYGAIKHLPAALKDAFIAKYAIRSVNTTVKFDVWDKFTLDNLQQKIINNEYIAYGVKTVSDKRARKNALSLGGKYKLKKIKDGDGDVRAVQINEFPYIKFGDILTDLRRCLAIINETPMAYIFKDVNGADGKNITRRTTHAAIARDKLKHIIIKYIASDITFKSIDLWTLLMSNNNSSYITYPAAEFYSTVPNVFSYYYPAFQQCVYDTIDTTVTDYHKMNNLERWIHHVNNVICDGDETAIQYVHAWIARPLQNPLHKNKTALIIKGKRQGTGKSWFAEIVTRLHGKFGAENIGDMKNICGNFNAIIDNKTLILVNEVPNVDNSKYYDDDRLKGLISDDKTEIEYKGENSEVRDIYANFIFVSNNETPIRITDNDRRYVVLRPSEAHGTINRKQDTDYWTPAFYYLKEDNEFLAQLYSYYMNLNIKYYNPANIPDTLALTEIIEQSRPRIHDFITEHYNLFVKGWNVKCAFEDYKEWAKSGNYQNVGNKDTFRNNLRDYVIWVKAYPHGKNKPPVLKLPQQKFNGKPVYVYKLNEQYTEYFKPCDDNVIFDDDKNDTIIDENVKDLTE